MGIRDITTMLQGLPHWAPFAVVLLLAVLLLMLAAWAMLRARGSGARNKAAAAAGARPSWDLDAAGRLGGLWRGLRHLNTRREWRYRVPWILMLGERGAGKSSMVASLTTGQRQQLLLRERRLSAGGTDWAFFDGGVVIDVDGRLPTATNDADEGAGRRWCAVLDQIDRYRPERPIDGAVVAVSARSLLAADPALAREAAEQCYRQLWTLQKSFEFTLPVYLVVTQCDAVPGFEAFWQVQPASRRKQMVGWANPYGLEHDFEPGWVDQAFDEVDAALQSLLLQAAAQPERIDDFDEFFLYPREFDTLRGPLRTLMNYVFRPEAYRENFALRGIWFSGSLASEADTAAGPIDQVDFVDALFDAKVFAERNLARPTRQGVLSRDRLIRRTQLGFMTLFVALLLTLGATAMRLDDQVDAALGALQLLDQPQAEGAAACVAGDVVYELLDKIARIDVDLVYPAIPASWFDSRVSEGTANYVSNQAFEQVIFPSLACHLEQRGKNLLQGTEFAAADGHDPARAAAADRDALVGYVTAVNDFEHKMALFQRISVQSEQSAGKALMPLFAELADYAYGRPLPGRVLHGDGQHVSALAKVSNQVYPQLPAGYQARLASKVAAAMGTVRDRLEDEVARGATLLEELDNGQGVPDAPLLYGWLNWVQQDWLSVGVDGTTVCGAIDSGLAPSLKALMQVPDYAAVLEPAADAFGDARCVKPALRRIAGLRAAPYGALFMRDAGGYRMIPALAKELLALKDLAKVPYMQLPASEGFRCQVAPAEWKVETVAEAASAIRQYQAFSRAQQPGIELPDGATPLYEQVARRKLLAVLDQLLARSQRGQRLGDTVQPTWVTPLSEADDALATRSLAFTRALSPLLYVLRAYAELGFNSSQAKVVSCLREFSSQNLARIDDLADASALYAPQANPSYAVEGGVKPYFNLGGKAQASDYLKRQLERAQVLVSYAAPFVELLGNTDAVDDATTPNDQSGDYWRKTINEINGFVQFKKPEGEVANIQKLVEQVLVPLAPENCGALLADYQVPPVYNDLFSHKRAALQQRADWYCHNHAQAMVWDQYESFAVQFNQALAGRYPFGPAAAGDAGLSAARTFLQDYQQQRDALAKNLAQLPAGQGQAVRLFIDQIDQLADFYGASLASDTAAQPINIQVGFRYRPEQSPGAAGIVRWRLAAGSGLANYPNGPVDVSWSPGQEVSLELDWANLGGVRPTTDPSQPGLSSEGYTARFAATGPWALMKFIDRHRSTRPGMADPSQPARLVLEFEVPLVKDDGNASAGRARVFVTLDLSSLDLKTGKPLGLVYPQLRPTSAPTIWGDTDK